MSDTKWTPGPWHLEDDHPKRAAVFVNDGDDWQVAVLYSGRGDADIQDSNGVWQNDPVRIANARLIAAAPELYEALEGIANHYDMDGYGEKAWKDLALEMAELARTAMAKARGDA